MKQTHIAVYKSLLREAIEQRPSGLRLKIAEVLGTHKSFISQITNPTDPTPIPARHLEAIFDVCHFSQQEKEVFLAAYRHAHPKRNTSQIAEHRHYKTLHMQIPVLESAEQQRQLEALLREHVRQLCHFLAYR